MGKLNQARDANCEVGELKPFFEAIKVSDSAAPGKLRLAILQDAHEICSAARSDVLAIGKAAEPGRKAKARTAIERLRLAVVFALSAAMGLGAGYAIAGSVDFVPEIVFGENEPVFDPDMFADVEAMLLGGASDV